MVEPFTLVLQLSQLEIPVSKLLVAQDLLEKLAVYDPGDEVPEEFVTKFCHNLLYLTQINDIIYLVLSI